MRLAGIVATLIGIAIVFVCVDFAARSLFKIEQARETERFSVPAGRSAGEELPRQPRLEPFEPQLPARESFAADARELEAQLHRYGQTEDAEFARVPIEIAIQRTAKQLQWKKCSEFQGLRERRRAIVSGEANSGRVFREGDAMKNRSVSGFAASVAAEESVSIIDANSAGDLEGVGSRLRLRISRVDNVYRNRLPTPCCGGSAATGGNCARRSARRAARYSV